MNYLKDKLLIVLTGTLLIIVILYIALSLNSNYHKNPDISRLNDQEKKVVQIVLENNTIKNELKGKQYDLIVNTQNISNNNVSSPFDLPYTYFKLLNKDGSIDYHLVVYVNPQNNSISLIDREKPRPK